MRRRSKSSARGDPGAEIVLYDRHREDRDAIAAAISAERKMAFVAPFDNFYVIAGQGTVGLELAEQAKAAGAELEAVLVPASGGGLTAGTALAVTSAMPDARIYTVEPEGFEDYARSLKSGVRESNAPGARSICDALLMSQPGELTFAMNKDRLAGGLVVTDEEVRAAVAFAFRELKLVVEPGGAAALAALLERPLPGVGGAGRACAFGRQYRSAGIGGKSWRRPGVRSQRSKGLRNSSSR